MYKATLLSALLLLGTASATAERWYRPQHAQAGLALFAQHCAACHGAQAQGAPNWHQRKPDGRFPPPPLNGSAHMWHHPLGELYTTVMHGQGNMPGFSGRLNKGEVLAIIAWLQSLWPDEIYRAWQRMDRQARSQMGE